MITNTTVTIYNAYRNGKAAPEYRRTVLSPAWYHRADVTTLSDKMLVSADLYRVRVPKTSDVAAVYHEQGEWAGEGWTLQSGDYVYIGEGPEIETPADLQKHKGTAFRITSWSDNATGNNPHWRIQGT